MRTPDEGHLVGRDALGEAGEAADFGVEEHQDTVQEWIADPLVMAKVLCVEVEVDVEVGPDTGVVPVESAV